MPLYLYMGGTPSTFQVPFKYLYLMPLYLYMGGTPSTFQVPFKYLYLMPLYLGGTPSTFQVPFKYLSSTLMPPVPGHKIKVLASGPLLDP